MNTTPRLYGRELHNYGCNRVGIQNVERAFWQSRMTGAGHRAEPIELVDLSSLARLIRMQNCGTPKRDRITATEVRGFLLDPPPIEFDAQQLVHEIAKRCLRAISEHGNSHD